MIGRQPSTQQDYFKHYMISCNNCNSTITENFCPSCGLAVRPKRIDSHYISHEIQHLLHVEKGIFFTIKELLIRPGSTIREYITENRSKLIKPVTLLILTSILYSIIDHHYHIGEHSVKQIDKAYAKSAVSTISHWVQNNMGYANIIMGVFIAIWVKIFFRKSGYNIYEITVLLCFVMGLGMFLFAIAAFLVGLLHQPVILLVATLLVFMYISWGIGQFFGSRKLLNYVKAITAYLLGFFTFKYAVWAIGLAYDYCIR